MTMPKPKPKTSRKKINARIPSHMYPEIEAWAAGENRSMNNMIVTLVKEALRARRESGR